MGQSIWRTLQCPRFSLVQQICPGLFLSSPWTALLATFLFALISSSVRLLKSSFHCIIKSYFKLSFVEARTHFLNNVYLLMYKVNKGFRTIILKTTYDISMKASRRVMYWTFWWPCAAGRKNAQQKQLEIRHTKQEHNPANSCFPTWQFGVDMHPEGALSFMRKQNILSKHWASDPSVLQKILQSIWGA